MATRERIGRALADIAGRPRAVRFEEIAQIVNQIRTLGGIPIVERPTTHGYQYTIGSKIIRVCKHNPGDSHVKKAYVEDFLDAMVELGFYVVEEE
jgi:hypothetical protein